MSHTYQDSVPSILAVILVRGTVTDMLLISLQLQPRKIGIIHSNFIGEELSLRKENCLRFQSYCQDLAYSSATPSRSTVDLP
jgi:hypothetical protein